MLLERRGYLEVLWQNLPDKSKVLFNKKVADIVEDDDGVEVFLSDGTSERGDIVIGADGVHSTVREKMWERANRLEPGIIDVKEKKGSVSSMIPTAHRLICDSHYHTVEMPPRVRPRRTTDEKRALCGI